MPNVGPQTKRKAGALADADDKQTGKRTRVSRACDQCRAAREKCDGIQPACFTCATSNRKCSYTANPKKRGIQPGYIRTLELALQWTFENVSNSESLLNNIIARDGTSSVLLGRNTSQSNKLHKNWRRSKFCKDIDKLLSGATLDDAEDAGFQVSDDGDTDTGDAGNAEESYAHETTLTVPITAEEIPELRPNLFPSTKQDTVKMRLPTHIWHLFDVYFARSHCWLPISEKSEILKISYSYPDDGLELCPDMQSSDDHAELWAIMALSAVQDAAEGRTGESYYPDRLYEISRYMIPSEQKGFGLGHIKAMILLALVNLYRLAPEAAWLLIGRASRMLASLEATERNRSSRLTHVYTSCFILDSILSMQLRRRSYFKGTDIDKIGRVPEEGLEEWQPWSGIGIAFTNGRSTASAPRPVLSLSSLNHLTELVRIMSDSESYHGTLCRFEEWKATLSQPFDFIRNQDLIVPATPPAILLLLAYHSFSAILDHTSRKSVQNITGLLERARETITFSALPPVARPLLDLFMMSPAFTALDQISKVRFQTIMNEVMLAWSQKESLQPTLNTSEFIRPQVQQPAGPSNVQTLTPQSLQLNSRINPMHNPNKQNSATESNLLEDLLPDMNPSILQRSHPPQFSTSSIIQDSATTQFTSTHLALPDTRNLENFFDELASLDGAEGLDNQPQFMQNLGFAPDADITELLASDFGRFDTLQSAFM